LFIPFELLLEVLPLDAALGNMKNEKEDDRKINSL
jgi:hypothetical protein